MKRKNALIVLGCLILALLVSLGGALAEEGEVQQDEIQQADLQLFTAGSIPQPMRMRAVTPVGFEDYVAEQLRAQAESIYVLDYAMTPDALRLALSNIINENPDLFYIGSKISYTTGSTSGNVYRFFPEYLYTGEDLSARIAAFDSKVNEIAAYARAASTEVVGQMLAVNNYFCVHYEYDDTLSIYSPDQLFTGGTGVCQAYMLGYAAVMDELGIANTHATSYEMNHTWNMVELGGEWYHVDVTWNDPRDTLLQARCLYFLLSDEGMTASDHYGWTASYVAADATYDDYFWRDARTPMAISGDTVFFVDSAVAEGGVRTVRSWTIGADTTQALHDFSIADADGSYFYTEGFGPICTDGGKLYYASRESLYSISKAGGERSLVYSCVDSDRYIWSCWMQGSTVQLLVGDSNRGNAAVLSFPLDNLNRKLTVPASIRTIGQEAFTGVSAWQAVLPEGLKTIEARAFAACSDLHMVNIPASVSAIAEDAFADCANLTLIVSSGSFGAQYADEQGIHSVILD